MENKIITNIYQYPDESLISNITSLYNQIEPFPLKTSIPLPDKRLLLEIVNICYQASMRKEESRSVSFRICIYDESFIKSYTRSPLNGHLIAFEKLIPFNVSELVKISPAASPANSIFLIQISDSNLNILGILQTGSSFSRLIRYESNFKTNIPPDLLTITSLESGNLNFSRRGIVFERLRSGKTRLPGTAFLGKLPFDAGYLGKYFQKVLDNLFIECQRMSNKEVDSNFILEYSTHLYFSFLNRLLVNIYENHHGGTVLIIDRSRTKLEDSFQLKYQTKSYIEPWNTFLRTVVDRSNILFLDNKFRNSAEIPIEDFKSYKSLFFDWLNVETIRAIGEQIKLYSSFANVDGALVLDFNLNLIGFGAVTKPQSENSFNLYQCEDNNSTKKSIQDIEQFGTRHRSAFRFSHENPSSVGFIISQDGAIKGICSDDKGDVLYWNNLEDYFQLY